MNGEPSVEQCDTPAERARISTPVRVTPLAIVLGAILAALVVPTLMGIDLRFKLQRGIAALLGIDAMYAFTIRLGLYSVCCWSCSIGPCAIPGLLIADSLWRSRRRAWAVPLIVLGMAVAPIVYVELGKVAGRTVGAGGTNQEYFVLAGACWGVVLAGLVGVWAGSWRAAGWLLGAVAAAAALDLVGASAARWGGPSLQQGLYWLTPLVANAGATVAVVVFAITQRRRARLEPYLCPRCAYDLRGLGGAACCPECGGSALPTTATEVRSETRPASVSTS